MTKRMLIDATHAEETRVAVVDGTRLVEFDYESKVRKQLKSSIFLAKVTRVEPSLQAAFVNFGGNRHGFLPFSEIHTDYYRIPVADREALIAEQQAEMEARRRAEEEEDREEENNQSREPGASPERDEEDHEAEHIEEVGGQAKPHVTDEDEHESAEAAEAGSEAAEAAPKTYATAKSGETVKYAPEEAAREESIDSHTAEAMIVSLEEPVETDGETDGTPVETTQEAQFDYSVEADHDEDADIEGEPNGNVRDPSDDFMDDAEENGEAAPVGGDNESAAQGEGGEGQDNGEPREGRDRFRGRDRGRGRGGRGRSQGHSSHGRGGRSRYANDSTRVDSVGGDGVEGDHAPRSFSRRHYKIQEVIKRGQIMLVQASKEERGNKGAAVTTYLSLPGRYCVLMPNSPRGGGVSRKIASFQERRRMRELLAELKVPEGMSVIMRTAGVSRTKPEIKRDLDYLLRLWDEIRETTLQSTAPATIHEEGNLVRRSIRDIYTSEIEEVLVAGDDGYKFARDFMKMMIPSHAKRVKQYKDDKSPLFTRYQIESQIKEMSEPSVTLRSGGYLVINPTEALVSIDVNSGRATKERHIEETAVKTNLEAAEEVARQLRLRDLGGLVVIDFIDMEDRRNNRRVEERLKQALSSDRARIQVGRISSFGLMELSRQRLNPSLTEAQFEKCPHCRGMGVMRTTDSAAIFALRALEEEAARNRGGELHLFVPSTVALYIFNNKRDMVNDLERRHGFRIVIQVEEETDSSGYRIEAVKNSLPASDEVRPDHRPARVIDTEMADDEETGDDAETESEGEADQGNAAPSESESREGSSRRRGRRGGRRRRGGGQDRPSNGQQDSEQPLESVLRGDIAEATGLADEGQEMAESASAIEAGATEGETTGRSRRGRRGGRNRGRQRFSEGEGDVPVTADGGDSAPQSGVESASAMTAETISEPAQSAPRRAAVEQSSAPVSNDTAPPPPRDYEKVNEEPESKKKGWWNRLTE
jgi:ribonuclease E